MTKIRNINLVLSRSIISMVSILYVGFIFLKPTSITIPIKLPSINISSYVEPELIPANSYNWNIEDKHTETLCLAKNIYFEGRGESIHGQIAIGLVTINRVKHSRFPKSICEVVFQKGRDRYSKKLVAQFSWTLDKHSNQPKNNIIWKNILFLAQAMTSDGTLSNFHDFTDNALYYHANYINPNWYNLTFIKDIETHKFYGT